MEGICSRAEPGTSGRWVGIIFSDTVHRIRRKDEAVAEACVRARHIGLVRLSIAPLRVLEITFAVEREFSKVTRLYARAPNGAENSLKEEG
jgi:hypothetical protein